MTENYQTSEHFRGKKSKKTHEKTTDEIFKMILDANGSTAIEITFNAFRQPFLQGFESFFGKKQTDVDDNRYNSNLCSYQVLDNEKVPRT